jgi:hypothetical protein
VFGHSGLLFGIKVGERANSLDDDVWAQFKGEFDEIEEGERLAVVGELMPARDEPDARCLTPRPTTTRPRRTAFAPNSRAP